MSPSDFGAPKGSHIPMTAGRCGVSNPVRQLQKGVHQTNREDTGPSSKETQKVPSIHSETLAKVAKDALCMQPAS